MHTIVKLLLACYCFAPFTSAQVLGSHQLAAGEWKVQLRGRFDPTTVFPRTESNLPSEIVPRRGLFGTNVLDCICSLSDDGTFLLRPEQSNQNNHLAVRGRWKVMSNPYCITDRFYDQLTMNSYPRQHIMKKNDGETIIDSITAVKIHARLWGRYSRNKPGRCRGKLSHGSLMVSCEKANQTRPWWLPKQSIEFSAVRIMPRSSEEDWEDKKYFGY